MPVERTPKTTGAAKRQQLTAKQHTNGGGQYQARGSASSARKRMGAGAQKRAGPPRLKEYEPPKFSQGQSLTFTTSNWHDVEAMVAPRLGRPVIKEVTFSDEFRMISEAHLKVIASHRRFAASLEMISMGDEETGSGFMLTDEGILSLVSATPNLRVLRLSSCAHLTDATLINVLVHCPRLESLRITGGEKSFGQISAKGLKAVRERSDIGTALKDLVLFSQAIHSEKELKALSKAKRGLSVTTGECPRKYAKDMLTTVYRSGKAHYFGMRLPAWL